MQRIFLFAWKLCNVIPAFPNVHVFYVAYFASLKCWLVVFAYLFLSNLKLSRAETTQKLNVCNWIFQSVTVLLIDHVIFKICWRVETRVVMCLKVGRQWGQKFLTRIKWWLATTMGILRNFSKQHQLNDQK